ncbi:MAG: hypothetical protein PVI59_04080 [Anaerolineae bacterium]|jgi:hypothetical protein
MAEEIIPRYEFRTFAQSFGLVEERIRQRPCENVRESEDVYVLSTATNEHNTKIRDEKMDIKVFVREAQGLEQWRPRTKVDFPIPAETIREEIFPAFDVPVPQLARSIYTETEFLDEVVWPHPELVVAKVYKLRFAFTVNGCITEIAHLLVNGAAIRTVAVESEDPRAVLEAKGILGLDPYENVNYLMALKRILGMGRRAE